MNSFDRDQHVYESPTFAEIINDTIHFFDRTPIQPIRLNSRFTGTGIYALYCVAETGLYADFYPINCREFRIPIYVGKAVPRGWRQARSMKTAPSYELHSRLRDHDRSLQQGNELDPNDFYCRFVILDGRESDLIGTVEAALIRQYQPLWNTIIDGFGNHDPGRGRYQQAKSDWDVCHPGRSWADRCQGIPTDRTELIARIDLFFSQLNLNSSIYTDD